MENNVNINVKSFILPDDFFETQQGREEKKLAPKKKPSTEYNTIFVSGPDFAIQRKTAKTSQVLVCFLSKNQFYVKNETAGGVIEELCDENLKKFLANVDQELEICDADGHRPFWVSRMRRDQEWRNLFLKYIHSPVLYPYLVANILSMEAAGACLRDLIVNYQDIDFAKAKKVYDLITEYSGQEEARNFMANVRGGNLKFLQTPNYFYGRQNPPSAYDAIFSRWGFGGIRETIRQFCLSPVRSLPDGRILDGIFYRDAFQQNAPETRFDLGAFVEYMFCACTEQGFADSPENFWRSWGDYLDQQMQIFGEVREKYSENLLSDHQRLSFRVQQLRAKVDEEAFEKAHNEMKEFEKKTDKFIIMSPETNGDLVEEGRRMSHCVGSYGKRVTDHRSYIFFLRKNNLERTSLATIEVSLPEFSLVQVRAKYNRAPSAEHTLFIDNWFAEAKEKYRLSANTATA